MLARFAFAIAATATIAVTIPTASTTATPRVTVTTAAIAAIRFFARATFGKREPAPELHLRRDCISKSIHRGAAWAWRSSPLAQRLFPPLPDALCGFSPDFRLSLLGLIHSARQTVDHESTRLEAAQFAPLRHTRTEWLAGSLSAGDSSESPALSWLACRCLGIRRPGLRLDRTIARPRSRPPRLPRRRRRPRQRGALHPCLRLCSFLAARLRLLLGALRTRLFFFGG